MLCRRAWERVELSAFLVLVRVSPIRYLPAVGRLCEERYERA